MKFLYVTDLHGDINKYEKALEIAVEKDLKLIVNGGDMYPKLGNIMTVQKTFIDEYLPHYFQRLKEHDIHYFTILGNDDLKIFDHQFQMLCDQYSNVENLHCHKACYHGYEFVGMNCVLDHPFGYKNRVVNESRFLPQRQLCQKITLITEHGFQDIDDWDDYRLMKAPLMYDILHQLPKVDNPRKSVYVMHMPPAGLHLGQLSFGDTDIGSYEIYDFLKEVQPLLSLHGHIHECYDTKKGKWINGIHDTTCIQTGQSEWNANYFVYALIDVDKQEYTREIAWF